MDWNRLLIEQATSRHKVFVSYFHHDDQYYRDLFEKSFSHIFISKSVKPGEIDSDLSTEYIKRIIQSGYISDSSVLIVLVGPNTRYRKHVDWEISAALNKKVGGYSGLMGILLPSFPLSSENKYRLESLPSRLADNVSSGYSKIYTWNSLVRDHSFLKSAIDDAFSARISRSGQIKNVREQMQRNLSNF